MGNNQFSTASMYKMLHNLGHKLGWCRDVWDHHNIPKHNFVGWLVLHTKLQTRTRLCAMNICADDRCLLCVTDKEERDHLFFECRFSRLCLMEIKKWLGINTTSITVTQFLGWVKRRHQGSKFRK